MYPLFESIKIQDGRWCNTSCHQQRMRQAQLEVYGSYKQYQLEQILIPSSFQKGIVKCRLQYGLTLGQPQFSHYEPKAITTLQLVKGNNLDYHLKYSDRNSLQELFDQRGDCDEIIICQQGMVCDTSYSNLLFFDGRHWLTPAYPLLRGTQRARLLDKGIIHEAPITIHNLGNFSQVMLINAMMDFEESRALPMQAVQGLNV